ncbi:CWC16 protein [Podospora fimiseda]|uniref:Splicing factor YJU2 n=1 Tax=Podospora fimiseda TaxID=252190 RepID=A0AAN7BSN1_9PEZI|nr:CWC16 protein [Podospora fimiseda]
MSERKVLTKYYPPDFDPSLVGRSRKPKGSSTLKVQTVRLMAPFSMQCTTCGEFIYRGRKFNSRKETPPDEKYLNIQLYRFYIRCTRCSAEIIFRTDPRNQDYIVEKGAKRNTDPWKRGLEKGREDETTEERLDRLMAEGMEGEEGGIQKERDVMMELEQKTEDAKREMAVADALDEIRSRNARLEKIQREGGGEIDVGDIGRGISEEEERRRKEEKEDEEAARRAFAFVRRQEMLEEVIEEDENEEEEEEGKGEVVAASSSSSVVVPAAATTTTTSSTGMPPPSFKRQVKKKKDRATLLGIKKKV